MVVWSLEDFMRPGKVTGAGRSKPGFVVPVKVGSSRTKTYDRQRKHVLRVSLPTLFINVWCRNVSFQFGLTCASKLLCTKSTIRYRYVVDSLSNTEENLDKLFGHLL
jgi:hypothetical protein